MITTRRMKRTVPLPRNQPRDGRGPVPLPLLPCGGLLHLPKPKHKQWPALPFPSTMAGSVRHAMRHPALYTGLTQCNVVLRQEFLCEDSNLINSHFLQDISGFKIILPELNRLISFLSSVERLDPTMCTMFRTTRRLFSSVLSLENTYWYREWSQTTIVN